MITPLLIMCRATLILCQASIMIRGVGWNTIVDIALISPVILLRSVEHDLGHGIWQSELGNLMCLVGQPGKLEVSPSPLLGQVQPPR